MKLQFKKVLNCRTHLSVNVCSVQLLDGLLGVVQVGEGDEGVALGGDVHVVDLADAGELVLDHRLGAGAVHSVDEHLEAVLQGKSLPK